MPNIQKGDPLSVRNVGYKIFSKVFSRKLEPTVKEKVRKYQCGFIASKSTSHQIFNLRQIMEKTSGYGIKTYYLLILNSL
jgi:hypothetical protein